MSINNVTLMGRITKDLQVQTVGANKTSKVEFSLALDRPKKEGQDKADCDFPRCIAWGKTAELIAKYSGKGLRLYVEGRIQTGSYEKSGQTVYTTDVVVEKVEFVDWKDAKDAKSTGSNAAPVAPETSNSVSDDELWDAL